MRNTLILAAGLIFSSFAIADWSIDERTDAMTDKVRKVAIIENDRGHSFSIYRISNDGAVWGNFSLSEEVFDQIDWEKAPIYRVDKNEPEDLGLDKKMQDMGVGIHAYEWEPKWVNFLLWHGKEEEGIANNLVELIEGQNVVFRYYLSTGGYKDTEFSLVGASSAIVQAIGITSKIDSSSQEALQEFRLKVVADTEGCLSGSNAQSCLTKVSECAKQANNDITLFKSCSD